MTNLIRKWRYAKCDDCTSVSSSSKRDQSQKRVSGNPTACHVMGTQPYRRRERDIVFVKWNSPDFQFFLLGKESIITHCHLFFLFSVPQPLLSLMWRWQKQREIFIPHWHVVWPLCHQIATVPRLCLLLQRKSLLDLHSAFQCATQTQKAWIP